MSYELNEKNGKVSLTVISPSTEEEIKRIKRELDNIAGAMREE